MRIVQFCISLSLFCHPFLYLLQALEEKLKKVQSELETEKTNSLKKNKLIKGLTQNLHDKMNEVSRSINYFYCIIKFVMSSN